MSATPTPSSTNHSAFSARQKVKKIAHYQDLVLPQIPTPEGFIRLAGPIERDNIVNGPGLRAVICTQGCRQRCPGCQNTTRSEERR